MAIAEALMKVNDSLTALNLQDNKIDEGAGAQLAVAQYEEHDPKRARELHCGNLSEETKLPCELLIRFHEMWANREPPYFAKVEEETDTMPPEAFVEVVRSLKVSSDLLCRSITRVVGHGGPISFDQFVRGYAAMHSRTLREALPFAFEVFDLDGDGVLCQEEFTKVLDEVMAMADLDATTMRKVLKAPTEGADGVTNGAFRYFATLSSQTILATCGFFLHVQGFYVPPVPFGSVEEEQMEEAKRARDELRARERAHLPRAAGGAGEEAGSRVGGEVAVGPDGENLNPFADPDFLAAMESLKTTPEERAARHKDEGNAAMKHGGRGGLETALKQYGLGIEEKCRDQLLHATLLGNRAATHLTLKNWGFALAGAPTPGCPGTDTRARGRPPDPRPPRRCERRDAARLHLCSRPAPPDVADAKAALETRDEAGQMVLPQPSAMRAARRAAQCALSLRRVVEAREMLGRALSLQAAGAPPDPDLMKVGIGIAMIETEAEEKRVELEGAPADAHVAALVADRPCRAPPRIARACLAQPPREPPTPRSAPPPPPPRFRSGAAAREGVRERARVARAAHRRLSGRGAA